MKTTRRWLLWPAIIFLLVPTATWAAKQVSEEIRPGNYTLQAVSNHTPGAYNSTKEFMKALQKVELEIGIQDQFRDLPKLASKTPYTGTIMLGDRKQKFGVIVDVVGDEKRLYVDTDGDGSFANEKWTALLNEWYGLQIYWVTAPEPIRLMVGYSAQGGKPYPIEVEIVGLLNQPGALFKEKPYLYIKVRSWFLGHLDASGVDRLTAIVDWNHNGVFNDPEDQIFIDANDDGHFSDDEAVALKSGINIPNGTGKINVSWGVYPDQLTIGGTGK